MHVWVNAIFGLFERDDVAQLDARRALLDSSSSRICRLSRPKSPSGRHRPQHRTTSRWRELHHQIFRTDWT